MEKEEISVYTTFNPNPNSLSTVEKIFFSEQGQENALFVLSVFISLCFSIAATNILLVI